MSYKIKIIYIYDKIVFGYEVSKTVDEEKVIETTKQLKLYQEENKNEIFRELKNEYPMNNIELFDFVIDVLINKS